MGSAAPCWPKPDQQPAGRDLGGLPAVSSPLYSAVKSEHEKQLNLGQQTCCLKLKSWPRHALPPIPDEVG